MTDEKKLPPSSSEEELFENVWQDLLKKASKHNTEPNATIFVFGESGNGKGHLLKKFKERSTFVKTPEYVLDYAYVHVKNIHDDDEPDETRARMNIWQLDTPEHAGGLLPLFLRSCGFDHLVYVITVDLSQPWDIGKNLNRWLEVLLKGHDQAFNALPASKQDELKLKISRYNQFYVDAARTEEKKEQPEDADVKCDTQQPKINLGVPLIIVGTKADALKKVFETQHGVGDRFDYITRTLRKFCLDYGATLTFTSAVGSGTNIDVLQEYVYHRLYNFPNKHPARAVLATDTEFGIHVPSGYDSEDLIASVQPARASWGESASWEDVFKNPDATKAKLAAPNAELDVQAEDNQTFYQKLKFNMNNPQPRPSITPITRPARPSVTPAGPPSPTAPIRKSASVSEEPLDPNAKVTGKPTAAAAKITDKSAVKDFFRSLLSDQNKKKAPVAAAKTRQGAQNALQEMRGASPPATSPTNGTTTPASSTTPTNGSSS